MKALADRSLGFGNRDVKIRALVALGQIMTGFHLTKWHYDTGTTGAENWVIIPAITLI
eukprot:m.234257 g.234257  ORF g.234257 m.234257 type:complete len:58 (+) comp54301_c0_seq21:2756-2929(+)